MCPLWNFSSNFNDFSCDYPIGLRYNTHSAEDYDDEEESDTFISHSMSYSVYTPNIHSSSSATLDMDGRRFSSASDASMESTM